MAALAIYWNKVAGAVDYEIQVSKDKWRQLANRHVT